MNITFIGGGNMASAIIGGLLQRGYTHEQLRAVEILPAARSQLEQTYEIKTYAAASAEALNTDCVVLAIKPQHMREAAVALAPLVKNTLIVSIAAGIRAADLSRWFNGHQRIVRVMPNTPALVLAGISGLYAMPAVSAGDRTCAEAILGAVGETVWFEREDDIDAVTAVSGSGPAYVFYFIEALEQAARDIGLSAHAARRLAIATFTGASQLAAQSSEDAATLRERVTSKGGTTERALASMQSDNIKAAIGRAVKAAAERSRELGDELGRG
ncbi:MAG: pyrroline-5-carboxylate reductase [Betaproteobacteria bacterium]|nr:pyrroline-5-carboxylate reductase [Betaproteobacteria bacterium]